MMGLPMSNACIRGVIGTVKLLISFSNTCGQLASIRAIRKGYDKVHNKITAKAIVRAIQQAQKAGKGIYLWDTALPGFGLYASPKLGKSSWLAQRWIGGSTGRPVRLAFDRYPNLSLDHARRKATFLISEIGNGTDIVSRKQQNRCTSDL
jgi:hypothetical protein